MILMTLEEFNTNYLELKDDTKKAINQLKDLTGKDVIFRLIKKEEANTFYKLKVKLARENMENHIIIINEDNVSDKNELHYYIVHEIVHGLRLFSGDKSVRKVLSADSFKLRNFAHMLVDEAKPLLASTGMGSYEMYNYCHYLANNFLQLVMNSAVDAKIELYIHENYPSLANIQKQAQKAYTKNIVAAFDIKNVAHIPHWMLTRWNAMNYYYLTAVTPIIGKGWLSKANNYNDSEYKEFVTKLLPDLNIEDKGQATDIEIIERWIQVLGVSEYVSFCDFEDIDELYISSN